MTEIVRHLIRTRFGQIHCRVAGAGPKSIVLLTINQQSSALYLEMIEALAPSLRVIAMDYPSHGDSDHIDYQPTIADYAECAVAVADGLGVARFMVLGEATGAAAATEIGVAYASRVDAVVLLNCPFYRNRDQAHAVHATVKSDSRPADPSGFPLTRTIDFFLKNDPSHAPLHPTQSWMDRMNTAQIEAGRHRWQALDALNAYDIAKRLAELTQPTLLLMGEHFHYTPILDEYRRRIRHLIAAEIIAGARFCMGWEKAEEIGARVRLFASENR